jgi:general secretion pathway protein E
VVKKIQYLKLEDMPKVPFVYNGIPSRFIRENKIVLLEFNNNILSVAMANPSDRSTIDALRVATSANIIVYGIEPHLFEEYTSKFYGQESQNINRLIEEIGDKSGLEFHGEDEEDIGHLKDLASEAPIIKLVNMVIVRAVENRASDIHIEPFEDELRVRYRIDGILHDIESVPKKLQAAIISRIKLTAKLNIAERRLPQDGRIRLKVAEKEIDLRISTIPVLYGESVVMRILDKESIVIDLERLGFFPETLQAFEQLIRKPNGFILVTGPTGSGKTTTLYGALNKINSPDRKIITVEDPVEYQLKGINQIQVKPQIGLNFSNTLRHIVRQDPDIIMIGETRDLETAQIAIQAALTGHLVFSTLHTNDAPSAITRLHDMGVEKFLLSSTIRGILAQRLVRAICPSCKEPNTASAGPDRDMQNIPGEHRGRGCEQCSFTGYRGRLGIFELIVVDDAMRDLIMQNIDANKIRELARRNGMMTLLEDGTRKIKAGLTTLDELLRVIQED